jgi:hypothetical protein
MKRAHLTALAATLAMAAVAAPRLAAQDTSAAGDRARPDTSGYTGAGGVDTTAADSGGAGRAAAADSMGGGADTGTRRRPPQPLRDAPGHVDAADTTGALGASDTSGMKGRHPDKVHVGDTNHPRPTRHAADSGAARIRSGADSSSADSSSTAGGGGESADTARLAQPTTQPGQTTSPAGPASDSTRSQ